MSKLEMMPSLATELDAYLRRRVLLRWNWGAVLLFVAVWCYGFEAYGTSTSPLKSFIAGLTAVLAVLIVNKALAICGQDLRAEVSFTYFDVVIALSYVSILTILSFAYIQKGGVSLNGDQLHHAQSSQVQAAALLDMIVEDGRFYGEWQYSNVLRIINAGILTALCAIAWLISKSQPYRRGWVICLVMLLLRYFVDVADIHPPLRLFPLWIASFVLGINDAAFRLVSLAALSGLALVVNKALLRQLGTVAAFFSGLAVSTIPLALHIGSIVEQSIWTTLTWSALLLAIRGGVNEKNAIWVMSIACIASLLRAPIFVIILPILILILSSYIAAKDQKCKRNLILSGLPLLVLAPALFIQLTQGTPATDGQANMLARLSESIADGFSLKIFAYNVPIPWMGFFLFAFLRLRGRLIFSAYASFFVLAYIVFYSIRPVLWGIPRYQAELWLPFAVFGFVEVLGYLGRQLVRKGYITIAIAALVVYNVNSNMDAYQTNLPANDWLDYFDHVKTGEVRIWSEAVYNVKDALDALRLAGYAKQACKVGQVHEVFSEVLAGYTVMEMRAVFDRVPECSRLNSMNQAKLMRDVRVVLFLDVENRKAEISYFLRDGSWKPWMSFHNSVYGSTVIGLIRS